MARGGLSARSSFLPSVSAARSDDGGTFCSISASGCQVCPYPPPEPCSDSPKGDRVTQEVTHEPLPVGLFAQTSSVCRPLTLAKMAAASLSK